MSSSPSSRHSRRNASISKGNSMSFPARSLGGLHKGMPQNYEARFRELVEFVPLWLRRLERRRALMLFEQPPDRGTTAPPG